MFIGVDVGTSSSKAMLLDLDGRDHVVSRKYAMTHEAGGRVEIDPLVVRDAVFECIGELATIAADRGGYVRSISMSVSGNEATAIDADGNPLANTIATMDTRGERQLAAFVEQVGSERLRSLTGLSPHVMHPLQRLLWMRDEAPDIFARTERFLCWGDLMAYWLGAEPGIDFSMASCTMAFDIREQAWSKELLEAAQMSEAIFAPPVPTGTVLGEVKPAVAEELGLGPGVLIVAGGFDQQMAAAGVGCLAPGDIAISAGTWEAVLRVQDSPSLARPALDAGLIAACYVRPNLYSVVANNPGGSSVITWMLDVFGREELAESGGDAGKAASLLISRADPEPTNLIMTPHHAGAYNPWMDGAATGVVHGLTFTTTREQLVKGALEGITYELRANLEALTDSSFTGEIVVAGGSARSAEWMQLRADVLDRELSVIGVAEPGALAAAAISAAAIDPSLDVDSMIRSRLGPRSVFTPRLAHAEQYHQLYARYQPFYRATAQFRAARVAAGSNTTDGEVA